MSAIGHPVIFVLLLGTTAGHYDDPRALRGDTWTDWTLECRDRKARRSIVIPRLAAGGRFAPALSAAGPFLRRYAPQPLGKGRVQPSQQLGASQQPFFSQPPCTSLPPLPPAKAPSCASDEGCAWVSHVTKEVLAQERGGPKQKRRSGVLSYHIH